MDLEDGMDAPPVDPIKDAGLMMKTGKVSLGKIKKGAKVTVSATRPRYPLVSHHLP